MRLIGCLCSERLKLSLDYNFIHPTAALSDPESLRAGSSPAAGTDASSCVSCSAGGVLVRIWQLLVSLVPPLSPFPPPHHSEFGDCVSGCLRASLQRGAKLGLPLRVRKTEFMLVLLFINYCLIFHKATITLLLLHPIQKDNF